MNHLVYATSGGSHAIQLHEGWPAGGPIDLKPGRTPVSLAVRDAPTSSDTLYVIVSQDNKMSFGTISGDKRVGAELTHCVTHRSQIDNCGNAGQILE